MQGGESALPALPLNSAPLKTSDLYEVKNIPERFNHPGICIGREELYNFNLIYYAALK